MRTEVARGWCSFATVLLLTGVASDAHGRGGSGKGDDYKHTCVHSEVSIPYDELVTVDSTLGLRRAYVAENDNVSNNTQLNATAPASTEKVEKQPAKKVVRRNLRFYIHYMLERACKSVGEVVPSYIKKAKTVCTADDVLTNWKKRSLKVMMEAATKFLSSALLVDPLEGVPVTVENCSGLPIPLLVAKDSDYVVYVTANPRSERGGTTVAWALACVRDRKTGRPVVGHINFIPSSIQRNPASLSEHVAMHELAHAIGFSNIHRTMELHATLRKYPTGGAKRVFRSGLRKNVTIITSPKVLEVARKYFGCPELDGVEVEDAGIDGTQGSHWKKRILFNEALVGSVTSGRLFFSSLTLAYFEDLGYYTANYSAAEDEMSWGRGRGCDFLYKRCNEQSKNVDEFCFSSNMLNFACTRDRSSLGGCDLTTYSEDLSPKYRYFDDPRLGGSSPEMDYCPALMGFENAFCGAELGFPFMNIFGNEMGTHSLCYDSDIITSVLPRIPLAARCFPTTCTPSGQMLLRIQGFTVECPKDGSEGYGDTSKLKGIHGKVKCPNSKNFCRNPAMGISKLRFGGAEGNPGTFHDGVQGGHSLPTPDVDTWSPTKSSCDARQGYLQKVPYPFPACSLAARKLKEYLGSDCRSLLSRWSYLHAVTTSCGKPEKMVKKCMDGWRGVVELCKMVS
uniref:Leishmanolysin-like peptidase n=1 Tax=Trypanosoma congolense (strain IL3000) TaxID=1068625 RepID=G0V133_TRYCI|nr:Major Surface Protease [Trypanosoma congolense IL3000]